MPNANEQLVLDFCQAWSRLDADAVLAYFADDAVYHNMPIEPARGHEEIRKILDMFLPASQKVEFEMLHVASAGDVVFTERVDRFWMGETTIALPVTGVFELRDGKIVAWRDYFDLNTWMTQMPGGTP